MYFSRTSWLLENITGYFPEFSIYLVEQTSPMGVFLSNFTWYFLESNMKAYRQYISGCGK